jgi:hypothetical protein
MRNLIVELQVFKADNEKLKKEHEDQQEINEVLLRSIVTKKIPKDNDKEEEVSKRASKNSGLEARKREQFCNVPTLGHHHRVEIYDDQSSQMDARESTWVFERHCGVQLTLMIIFHHYEPFRTGWLWFHCIPTISMILTILSYKSMEFTEEVILGTLLGGTSQCNSSLESGGETLQDGMARSDFQWPGKPQGEIRSFSKVKRLIN